MEDRQPVNKDRVADWLKIGGAFVAGVLLTSLFTCHGPNEVTSDAKNAASEMAPYSSEAASPQAVVGEMSSNWSYRQDEDQMTGKTTKFASVTSTNFIYLDSPYDGAQQGTLMLRNHPRSGHDVMIMIERGQVLCDSFDGCSILVRFDDDPPSNFTALTPADNSSEMLFIQNYSRFATRLKTAKRVRIQLNIYQNGSQTLEFNTAKFDGAQL